MSEVTFNSNTFAGNIDPEVFTRILLGKGGLAERGLVNVKTGIKKRRVIQDMDVDVEFQEPNAKFNDDGLGLKVDENYLDPVAMEVMKEMDFSKLVESWQSDQMSPGAMNDYDPPASVEDFLMERMAERIGIGHEELYILGKERVSAVAATFSANYPGILNRIKANPATMNYSLGSIPGVAQDISGITSADPGVVTVQDHGLRDGDMVTIKDADGNQQVNGESINGQSFAITVVDADNFDIGAQVTGSTAATEGQILSINSSNVDKVLAHAYQRVPQRIAMQNDFKLLIPYHVEQAYKLKQAFVADGAGSYTVGDRALDFIGKTLESMPHWENNHIVGWNASNVYLGLDLESDEENIEMKAMRESTLDNTVRYKARMKSDINAKFFDEIYSLR